MRNNRISSFSSHNAIMCEFVCHLNEANQDTNEKLIKCSSDSILFLQWFTITNDPIDLFQPKCARACALLTRTWFISVPFFLCFYNFVIYLYVFIRHFSLFSGSVGITMRDRKAAQWQHVRAGTFLCCYRLHIGEILMTSVMVCLSVDCISNGWRMSI